MAEDIIDLTNLQDNTRCSETRWNIWEKHRTSNIVPDATLMFRSRRFLPNEDFIITDTSNLKRIPPQSLLIKLSGELLSRNNYVLVWDGYGVFDWNALNSLSNLYQKKIVSNEVEEEFQWIRKNGINDSQVDGYMFKVWHKSQSNKDRESLLCKRLLTDGIIQEVLDICNKTSSTLDNKSQFLLLNNIDNYVIKPETEEIHLVINVTRRKSTVYVTPLMEEGSHWTYLYINRKSNSAVYSDSLGWAFPTDLNQKLLDISSKFTGITVKMLHHPNITQRQHACSTNCSKFAPLQSCGNVCGVASLILCILSFEKTLWKETMGVERSQMKDWNILNMIRDPTAYSNQLRMMLMSCIELDKISVDVLFDFSQNGNATPLKYEYSVLQHYEENKGQVKHELKDFITGSLKRKNVSDHYDKKKKAKKTPVQEVNGKQNIQSLIYKFQKESKSPQKPVGCKLVNENDSTCIKMNGHSKESEPILRNNQENCVNENIKTTEERQESLSGTEQHINRSKIESKVTESLNEEEKKMLKEVLKAKNSKRKQKTGKSEKKIKEQTIQSLFERQSDKEPASKSSTDSNLKTFPDHVYTSGLTFKGLSKRFYFNNGRNIGKNAKRNDNRNENPLLEEDGKTVGLKRLTTGNRDSKKTLISKVLDFIKNNGPVIKTQHVCSYYQTLIKSNARAMSSEFIEKLGKYSEIKQIYVNGTGYIITGENQHVSPLIKQLEEMSRSKDQEHVKHLIKNRIKNTYTGAIKSLKDPHDKQILKGLMANITTAEFMTQLEGKKNKSGYMNSRDTLDLRVKEYQNIEQTCLSVRNDMTNQQQAAFYKRMITRRKTKELKTVFEGRGRMLKCEQYPDLAAVLEFCFSEYNPRNANGGLESHPRLTDGILYRSCDNSKTMKQAREIIMAVAPEGFQISLSSCYNYTENYRSNSHQAIQHHAGKNINAKIALNAPQRTGVPQLVVNLHWSSANANIILDMAYERQDSTFVDSKDAKAIVCANVAPVQKPGRTWKKRVYLDHDWDQSKTFAITPMTHLILQTEKQVQITSGGTVIRTKRTGRGISILNLSYFEPETAFKTLNEIFIMMIHPETSHFFRNPDSGEFKKDFVFVVDNGPSTAPNNLIVKMCLLRLFHFLKLRSLCQVSYAEYNSKRNPVERVHAEENKALSRHGPFEVETKFIKVGSNDHKIVMENMLHEVSSCLRSGTFNNESLITVRGTQEDSNVFSDEKELKSFLTLHDDIKELNESTYIVNNNKTTQELNLIWDVDMTFERKYADDLYEIGANAISNKYTFRVCENEEGHLQPIPDYIKFQRTGELHYCDYENTKHIFQISDNNEVKNQTDFFLPSKVLYMAFLIFDHPPQYIKQQISILSWIPPEDVEKYMKQKEEEEKKLAEKDKESVKWKGNSLFKLKKRELINMCKQNNVNHEGTKVDLIKRLSMTQEDAINEEMIYSGELETVPNTLSGISSLTVSTIRSILFHHGIRIVGSKEELVLRLFMLKHQPDLISKREREGLLDLIKTCEHFIKIQVQKQLVSLDHERTFSSNQLSTTRQKVLNNPVSSVKFQLPVHIQENNLPDLFNPLKEYILDIEKQKNTTKATKSLMSMKTPGNTIKVKWLREEVSGTGWQPGWYSAKVIAFNEDIDELTVEYIEEKDCTYTMKFTDMVSKGFIEPSKPLLAMLETYERLLTVGQIVEIKWTSEELKGTNWRAGWYEAVVVAVDACEDTITVCYKDEENCTYVLEVSPALNSSIIRLKK